MNDSSDDFCQTLDFNSVNPEKQGSEKMTWTRLFSEVRDYFVKVLIKHVAYRKGINIEESSLVQY